MIIAIFIFISLIPLFNYVCLKDKKIMSLTYMVFPLAIIQILTPIFINLFQVRYAITSPLYISIFSFYIFLFVGLSLFNVRKKILDSLFWKEAFKIAIKKWLPLFVSLLVFVIINLFVYSYFPDTEAYLTASFQFMNNLPMSFDGSSTLISFQYASIGMITGYASLFGEYAPIAYYFLNPFLMITIMISIINEISWSKILDKNYSKSTHIFLILVLFGLSIGSPFMSAFMTSGNTFIQSMILLVISSTYFYNKKNSWTNFINVFYFSFFSATGIINGTIVIVALMIVQLLYVNLKTVILTFVLCCFSILMPIFILSDSIISYSLIYSISLLLPIIFFLFYKKIKNTRILNFSVLNNLNLKNKQLLFIFQIFFLCASSVLVTTWFGFVYFNKHFYTSWLVFVLVAFNFFFMFNSYRIWKSKKEIDYISSFYTLTSIASVLLVMIISFTNFTNNSIWRIIYLNIGMGGPLDIIVIFLVICIIYFSNENKKIFFKRKLNIKTNYKILFSSFIFLSSGISVGFAVFNNISQEFRLFKITDDVFLNFNKVTSKDKQMLESKNLTGTVFTDLQIFYLLADMQNVSSSLFTGTNLDKIKDISTWNLSSYGLLKVSRLLYSDLSDKQIEQELIIIFSNLNKSKVNNIILDKTTDYYPYLFNTLVNTSLWNVSQGEKLVLFN